MLVCYNNNYAPNYIFFNFVERTGLVQNYNMSIIIIRINCKKMKTNLLVITVIILCISNLDEAC